MAHCPERVLPGRILIELVQNARVIGGITPFCARQAIALYQTFVKGECVHTNARTAEMAKLVENSYRDVNIAFANELSILCDKMNIDVWELIARGQSSSAGEDLAAGTGRRRPLHRRRSVVHRRLRAKEARLIRTAREVNDSKPAHVMEQVRQAARRCRVHGKPVIACLGLTYKANTDDLRRVPALHITADLAASGLGQVLAVDPHVKSLERTPAAGVELTTLGTVLAQAHIVVLLVDHDAFAAVKPEVLQGKEVIDTRGLWRRHSAVLGTHVAAKPLVA